MVKTPNRPTVRCKSWKKRDLKETFFFLRLHSGKENTHIPSQLLDSSFLDWDYIPEQGKLLDTVQLLDITTRVLFPNYFTTTRVCTHTSWLPE